MKNENPKTLIIGNAGFIASHLTDKLISNGWSVIGVDDLSTGNIKNVNKKVKFICNTSNNLESKINVITEYIENIQFDYIFHLAASASVPFCTKNPLYSNKNNVDLTLRILDACKNQKNLKKFVFASSSAVYGDSKSFPTSEEDEINPLSPYALQKYTSETYCNLYKTLYYVPTLSFRLFNVFGPKQYGQGPYANVISSWASKLVQNQSIRLDGSGTQSRDFVYVNDVVDLMIKGALNDNITGTYNLGTSKSHTVLEVLNIFKNHFNNIQIDMQPSRVGDPHMTMADITKLQKDFGEYKFSDFKESLDSTIQSYIASFKAEN